MSCFLLFYLNYHSLYLYLSIANYLNQLEVDFSIALMAQEILIALFDTRDGHNEKKGSERGQRTDRTITKQLLK